MVKVMKADKLVLWQGRDNIWIERTELELDELRAGDRREGRWCDDAGETILYGKYGCWELVDATELTITVTALRAKWKGYGRRPKGLMAGWSQRLNREVLFIG